MGQMANRMLIEVIFKAKEKLKERKTKIENSQKMMENRRNSFHG